MRTKQYLAAVRPKDGRLILNTMVYADEVVQPEEIGGFDALDKVTVADKELTMATQLIESLTEAFAPDKFRDTYREAVLALIDRKAAGQTEVVAAPVSALGREGRRLDGGARSQRQGREGSTGATSCCGCRSDQCRARRQAGPQEEGARQEEIRLRLHVPPAERTWVEIGERRLSITNLDKVLYPLVGFTKAQVIDYYVRIAPTMLQHIGDRGVTLRRWPNGVNEQSFFEKRCPSHRPDWMRTCGGPGDRGGSIDYCCVSEVAALAWTANLAALEIHAPMARCGDIETPTMVVFDLDPGAPATIVECCQVALDVRDVLDHLGLHVFAKTSGSKGLQLYVPLNTAHTHEQASSFALAVGQLLEKQFPQARARHHGQGGPAEQGVHRLEPELAAQDDHRPYSLRALERPTASTPIDWDEVAAGPTVSR